MHMQRDPGAINACRVIVEIVVLAAGMLLLGIGVAVAVAMPVIVWALTR